MTIPASDIVTINPGVLSAGGNPLSLNGVILSASELLPTGAVHSFASADAVSDFFGPLSDEYAAAKVYFLGFDNSTIKPSTLFFAPYAAAARAAWLQSGSLKGMTLARLQALSGVLTVTANGTAFTSSSINLATATSFSDAASKINAAFTGTGKPVAAWNSVNSTFTLTSPTTGAASTIAYASGTLSAGLKLTDATGAVLSQGADADTPATAMDMVKSKTQNWATFTTMFEPNLAKKTAFAEWSNAQNQRYLYVAWDTDAQAIVDGSTSCFGAIAADRAFDGVTVVYNTLDLAVFVLGTAASIDFSRHDGRITFKHRAQSGFIPTVTDLQTAGILRANGYNFYGSWAPANDQFNGFAEGSMPGKWRWIDPFVDEVFLNSQLQLALMTLLFNVNSVPYNQAGYSLIKAAMADPIAQALNAGVIRSGVALSALQKAQLNAAAGVDISATMESQGYYLQVLDPGAQARGNRVTPVINFWYTDGGAVHNINVASVDVM